MCPTSSAMSGSSRRRRRKSVAPRGLQEEVELPKKLENTCKTQFSPAMESVPAAASVTGTLEEKPQITVSGSVRLDYELDFISGSSFYNGTYTDNGTTTNVSFLPFGEAEVNKILGAYKSKCDGLIAPNFITPTFITYCEQISKWVICYPRFHCYLEDWLTKWHRSNCVEDSNGLPHPEIRGKIRELLKSVDDIHKNGLQHMSLSDISNYVVINENWYIINISSTLDSDSTKRKSEIVSDFHGLRDMLKKYVLSKPSWQESKDFLGTFDMINNSPARLVRCLLDHAFFKCSLERLKMYSEIYHGLRDQRNKCRLLTNAITNGLFKKYSRWNEVSMGDVLSAVYKYEENRYRSDIQGLLRFLRNVYEHYKDHNGNVVDTEKEVRRLWPGLLEKLLSYC